MIPVRLHVLAALVAGWGLACGPGTPGASPAPPPPRSLTVLLPSDVLSLDPNAEVEAVTDSVLFNVFEPLVGFDASLQLRPVLARSWENPSPERWRFRLREDARFHDGTPLTADAVRASLEALQRTPAHEAAQGLNHVRDIRAVDGRTLEIVTREPRAILAGLTLLYIVKPNTPGAFPPLLGTGAYRLQAREAGRVSLESWPGWRGAAPAAREATFLSVPDEAARIDRLARGEADIAYGISAEQAGRPRPGVRFVRGTSLTVVYLGFNLRARPGNPFRDPRVRQAFHLAIDRGVLVRRGLRGAGRVATQPVAPLVFGFEPALEPPRHDLAAAVRLLGAAGVARSLRARLDFAAFRLPVAQLLKEQLAAAGVALELNPLEPDDLYALGKAGRSDLFLMGWNCTSGDAGEFYEFCLHTPASGYGSANYGGYSSPRIDEVARSHAALLDQRQRQALLREAAGIAMRDLPVLPLYVEDDIYAARDHVDFSPRPDSQILLTEVALKPPPR